MILRFILAVSLSLIVSTASAGSPFPTICLDGVVYYKGNGDGFNKGYGYMAPKWLPSGNLALCGAAKAAAEARDREALDRLKAHNERVREYLENPLIPQVVIPPPPPGLKYTEGKESP